MSRKLNWVIVLTGFGMVLLAAKLWLIAQVGHALPSWDQWDSECEITLRPWLEHRLTPAHIFLAHVEHRIVTTKLTLLGLLIVNGQWDNLVEVVLAAIVHAVCGILILMIARRWIGRVAAMILAALIALLIGLPFAWQNTVIGFQIQFYYVLLFSILHVHLVTPARALSLRWWLGMLAGALAVLSMASGLLAPAAVALVVIVRLLRQRTWNWREGMTILLSVALAVTGWLLKHDEPGHDFLKVTSAAKFISNVLLLLSWPASSWFPWTVLMAAPLLVFMYRWLIKQRDERADAAIGTFCVWQLLQICAVAYSRGGAGSVLTSRYLDIAATGVILSWVCLMREFTGRTRQVCGAIWLTLVVGGLVQQTGFQWRTEVLPENLHRVRQEENVRAYLLTGDRSFIDHKPLGEIPYPNPDVLAERLSHPSILGVIPWSVRKPVEVAFGADTPRNLPPSLPAAPAPVALSTWSLPPEKSAAIWRSAVHDDSTLPVLRFRLTGDIQPLDRALRLVVKSNEGEVEVTPPAVPNNEWLEVNVTRPRGEWWIEARDADPSRYFAFTEPVELTRGSYFAGELIKSYWSVGFGGLVLLAVGFVLERNAARRMPLPDPVGL